MSYRRSRAPSIPAFSVASQGHPRRHRQCMPPSTTTTQQPQRDRRRQRPEGPGAVSGGAVSGSRLPPPKLTTSTAPDVTPNGHTLEKPERWHTPVDSDDAAATTMSTRTATTTARAGTPFPASPKLTTSIRHPASGMRPSRHTPESQQRWHAAAISTDDAAATTMTTQTAATTAGGGARAPFLVPPPSIVDTAVCREPSSQEAIDGACHRRWRRTQRPAEQRQHRAAAAGAAGGAGGAGDGRLLCHRS